MPTVDKENVVKMQKLRRAIDRLRNTRLSDSQSSSRKRPWLARLRERLGLGSGQQEVAES